MIVYRHASFATPLRTEPARQPGRFHSGVEDAPTQYLCLHPLGPHAELLRGHDLRRPEQALAVRARTWALRLEANGLVEVGFDEALVADDVTACRELAARMRLEGVPGIVVPSAALPGTRNVVLFGARVGSPYLLEPLGEVDVPASVTAVDGRPLLSLLELVRFRGQPWPELPGGFEEPDWASA